jgi:hypothetical protein
MSKMGIRQDIIERKSFFAKKREEERHKVEDVDGPSDRSQFGEQKYKKL